MTTLLVPDLSEWQGQVDWSALIGGGYPAVIIRAYNGSRADHQYARNRDEAHAHGVRALGLYAFLEPGDIEHQAQAFVDLVGKLRAGEWPIVDYEANGLEPADIKVWVDHVAGALHGSEPWLYTGEYLYRSEHLADRQPVPAHRTWLAAYGPDEPSESHELWQYTDHRTVPGVSGAVDCSAFHGDVAQLLTAATGAAPAPTPGPTTHPNYPYPVGIHPGGTSPSAKPLQEALKRTGWLDPATPESDHYGPATQAAVGGFNDKHHLNTYGTEHDPAIGPRGWALLMSLAYGMN